MRSGYIAGALRPGLVQDMMEDGSLKYEDYSNQGIALNGLTTVNLDFLRMYRPHINVVTRPVEGTGGTGISLVGHHEVLIPLLAAAIIESE